MKRVPNRKKLRREYLRKKGGLLSLICGQVVIYLALFTGFVLTRHGNELLHDVLMVTLFLNMIANLYLTGFMKRTKQKLKQLPYVPPVTSATLPADEVLVRGSIEPEAPQETLLRAAQGDEQSKPDELLRSHLP